MNWKAKKDAVHGAENEVQTGEQTANNTEKVMVLLLSVEHAALCAVICVFVADVEFIVLYIFVLAMVVSLVLVAPAVLFISHFIYFLSLNVYKTNNQQRLQNLLICPYKLNTLFKIRAQWRLVPLV